MATPPTTLGPSALCGCASSLRSSATTSAAPSRVRSAIAAIRRRACTGERPTGPTLPHPGRMHNVRGVQLVAASELPPRVALDDDLLIARRQRRRPPAPPRRRLRRRLHRPAVQHRRRAAPAVVAVVADDDGDRNGFQGRRYRTQERAAGLRRTRSTTTSASSPRAWPRPARLLADHGTLYVHLDPREAHYVKVQLDGLFGRDCFLNELIWAYDYGGKPKRRWPPKHDTILVYVKDPDALPLRRRRGRPRARTWRPGSWGPRRRARGKRPTVGVVAHDRADERPREDGLPDPEARRRRPARRSPRRRGPAAGAWTSSPARGRSARWRATLGRRFVLVDCEPEAIAVTSRRLAGDAHQTLPAPGV